MRGAIFISPMDLSDHDVDSVARFRLAQPSIQHYRTVAPVARPVASDHRSKKIDHERGCDCLLVVTMVITVVMVMLQIPVKAGGPCWSQPG